MMVNEMLRRMRIPTVTRLILNKELKKAFKELKPGLVLDIGSKFSPYKQRIPYTRYVSMDINSEFNPDIVSDIHDIKANSNSFNTVIATEVLEHCQDPRKAVSELYRVLKTDGVCILSTRFLYKYHPHPKDYYRFTQDSLSDLFLRFRKVRIIPMGNRIQAIWELLSIGYPFTPLILFNWFIVLINFKDNCPTGFLVIARK